MVAFGDDSRVGKHDIVAGLSFTYNGLVDNARRVRRSPAVIRSDLFTALKLIQKEQVFTARQNGLLQKNYEMARTAYQANAELYHDMRNHFLLLQNYLADGKVEEAQSYLEQLSGGKAIQNVACWTGLEAIDYILGQKAGEAERKQIVVTIHAESIRDCGIEPVDLCTILMNLLDNALEGAEKCPAYMKKRMDITIRHIHQFIK